MLFSDGTYFWRKQKHRNNYLSSYAEEHHHPKHRAHQEVRVESLLMFGCGFVLPQELVNRERLEAAIGDSCYIRGNAQEWHNFLLSSSFCRTLYATYPFVVCVVFPIQTLCTWRICLRWLLCSIRTGQVILEDAMKQFALPTMTCPVTGTLHTSLVRCVC